MASKIALLASKIVILGPIQNLLRKNIEKSAKIKDFGLSKPSQNPSKMPRKSHSQKACIFSLIFARKTLCCKSANIDFVSIFPIRNGSRARFFKSLLACIFGPKNLLKILPKRSPNPFKIDAENVLFFNIDFFGFRPRFWRVLDLQLGAKLAKLAKKSCRVRLLEPS